MVKITMKDAFENLLQEYLGTKQGRETMRKIIDREFREINEQLQFPI